MSKRAYIAATFFGLLIGGGVWLWPVGPMWVSDPGAGRIVGFSPDGRTLVTRSASARGDQHVARWDADSGRLLGWAVMACAEPKDGRDMRAIRASPDGNVALVGEGVQFAGHRGLVDFATGHWFLHDGATGRRLLGPIKDVNYVDHRVAFSSDGRWFAAYCGEPRSGVRQSNALGIFETATGKCVVEPAQQGGVASCQFARDGASAALCWMTDGKNGGKGSLIVRIVELPSGDLRRQVEMPCEFRSSVYRWDGRHLDTLELGKTSRRLVVYDLEEEPLGAGVADSYAHDHLDSSGTQVYFALLDGDKGLAHFSLIHPNARRTGLAG